MNGRHAWQPGPTAGRRKNRQSGVALAIVVWFIAGMSLLVVGIVSHARVDTRMAQLHLAGAKAAASGDGAIHLMMASLAIGRLEAPAPGKLPRAGFRLGEQLVEVTLVPTNGLLDINVAPPLLLTALFHHAGGLDPSAARVVADNVIEWRNPTVRAGARKGGRRFNAIEDLLRIDGVNRALFDEVRDYLAIGDGKRGGTNWAAAPESLMAILREADPRTASVADRQRNPDSAAGEAGGVPVAKGGAYRVDAIVRYGDDLWLRRRWVKMETQSGSSLPWQFSRTEAPRVVGKAI